MPEDPPWKHLADQVRRRRGYRARRDDGPRRRRRKRQRSSHGGPTAAQRRSDRRGFNPILKYLQLGVLSERQVYGLFDWDRPSLEYRQSPLALSLMTPLPEELREWASKRSSEAMVEAGNLLRAYASGGKVPTLRPLIELLDRLAVSKPRLLRTVVWPAVLALQHARAGVDPEVTDRLERLLLRLVRTAPEVVVAGIVNVGNPRSLGAAKKGIVSVVKKGKYRWRVDAIRRSVASATVTCRTVLLDPVRERLDHAGDVSTVRKLSEIEKALDAVVLAMMTHAVQGKAARVPRRPPGAGTRAENASDDAVPQPSDNLKASSPARDTETRLP